MDTVDISIKNLLQEMATAEEFENERLTFQVLFLTTKLIKI